MISISSFLSSALASCFQLKSEERVRVIAGQLGVLAINSRRLSRVITRNIPDIGELLLSPRLVAVLGGLNRLEELIKRFNQPGNKFQEHLNEEFQGQPDLATELTSWRAEVGAKMAVGAETDTTAPLLRTDNLPVVALARSYHGLLLEEAEELYSHIEAQGEAGFSNFSKGSTDLMGITGLLDSVNDFLLTGHAEGPCWQQLGQAAQRLKKLRDDLHRPFADLLPHENQRIIDTLYEDALEEPITEGRPTQESGQKQQLLAPLKDILKIVVIRLNEKGIPIHVDVLESFEDWGGLKNDEILTVLHPTEERVSLIWHSDLSHLTPVQRQAMRDLHEFSSPVRELFFQEEPYALTIIRARAEETNPVARLIAILIHKLMESLEGAGGVDIEIAPGNEVFVGIERIRGRITSLTFRTTMEDTGEEIRTLRSLVAYWSKKLEALEEITAVVPRDLLMGRFRIPKGAEVITLPSNAGNRWILGRFVHDSHFVQVPQRAAAAERLYVSAKHAQIAYLEGGYVIADQGSTNGTSVHRHSDAGDNQWLEMPSERRRNVELSHGDVIQLGHLFYRFEDTDRNPRLRQVIDTEKDTAVIALQKVAPLSFSPEASILQRIRSAGQTEIEVFLTEPLVVGEDPKYAVVVQEIRDEKTAPIIVFENRNGSAKRTSIPLSQIVTVRGRKEDLTSQLCRVADPQFRDKSYNLPLNGTIILVDFSDPRLVAFLYEYIAPIRRDLDAKKIDEAKATRAVWRVVHDYVSYGDPKVSARVHRVGDLLEMTVCNGRALIEQISLQFLGIRSRMEKGLYQQQSGTRHAWVRAFPKTRRGWEKTLILDPQQDRAFEVGKDTITAKYIDDDTDFDQSRMGTASVPQQPSRSPSAPPPLPSKAAPPSPPPPPKVDPLEVANHRLRSFLTARLGKEESSRRWSPEEDIRSLSPSLRRALLTLDDEGFPNELHLKRGGDPWALKATNQIEAVVDTDGTIIWPADEKDMPSHLTTKQGMAFIDLMKKHEVPRKKFLSGGPSNIALATVLASHPNKALAIEKPGALKIIKGLLSIIQKDPKKGEKIIPCRLTKDDEVKAKGLLDKFLEGAPFELSVQRDARGFLTAVKIISGGTTPLQRLVNQLNQNLAG